MDGILGLARNAGAADFHSGPLLVEHLAAQGTISSNVFSVFMIDIDDKRVESYVDFGEPRADAMLNPDDLVYLELDHGFFW